jgi:hypothetical protein
MGAMKDTYEATRMTTGTHEREGKQGRQAAGTHGELMVGDCAYK